MGLYRSVSEPAEILESRTTEGGVQIRLMLFSQMRWVYPGSTTSCSAEDGRKLSLCREMKFEAWLNPKPIRLIPAPKQLLSSLHFQSQVPVGVTQKPVTIEPIDCSYRVQHSEKEEGTAMYKQSRVITPCKRGMARVRVR